VQPPKALKSIYLLHVEHYSFICTIIQSYVPCLIHTCRDSFTLCSHTSLHSQHAIDVHMHIPHLQTTPSHHTYQHATLHTRLRNVAHMTGSWHTGTKAGSTQLQQALDAPSWFYRSWLYLNGTSIAQVCAGCQKVFCIL